MSCLHGMSHGVSRNVPFSSRHIHDSHHHQILGLHGPATASSSVARHPMVTAMQKMAVERARSGEIGIRPSERRRQVEEAQMAAGGGAYGAPRPDAYGAHPLPHELPPSARLCSALCGNNSLLIG